METFTQANGLGSDLVGAMARDADGDLWVATLAGLSRLHRAARFENYTTANGLSSNVITALLPRANGTLLIGTQDHGWNLWDGHKFHGGERRRRLDPDQHPRHSGRWRRHLWFATGNGIARCDCTRRLNAGGCSHWIEFGAADGLRSRETATNSHPSAWRSRDGHLWFATPRAGGGGPGALSGEHGSAAGGAGAVCGGRRSASRCMRAAPGCGFRPAMCISVRLRGVELYCAAEGALPLHAGGLRPRLDRGRRAAHGLLHEHSAGTATPSACRRPTTTALWNTKGAALAFELRPHFYQTIWFYVLLLLAAAGLVVLLLRLRLRRAEGEFRAVLGERNRIAREIHDTLAQGYVGISVQLEVLASCCATTRLEAAAQAAGSDARLCARGAGRRAAIDLGAALAGLGRDDAAGAVAAHGGGRRRHGLKAQFSIFGAYRPMPAGDGAARFCAWRRRPSIM